MPVTRKTSPRRAKRKTSPKRVKRKTSPRREKRKTSPKRVKRKTSPKRRMNISFDTNREFDDQIAKDKEMVKEIKRKSKLLERMRNAKGVDNYYFKQEVLDGYRLYVLIARLEKRDRGNFYGKINDQEFGLCEFNDNTIKACVTILRDTEMYINREFKKLQDQYIIDNELVYEELYREVPKLSMKTEEEFRVAMEYIFDKHNQWAKKRRSAAKEELYEIEFTTSRNSTKKYEKEVELLNRYTRPKDITFKIICDLNKLYFTGKIVNRSRGGRDVGRGGRDVGRGGGRGEDRLPSYEEAARGR